MLARLLLVSCLKSVTLGNRVAVKGTVEEGIEELFCEGRAPFDLWHLEGGNSRAIAGRNSEYSLIFRKQKRV
jgi:hypothetical protein